MVCSVCECNSLYVIVYVFDSVYLCVVFIIPNVCVHYGVCVNVCGNCYGLLDLNVKAIN